MAVSMVNNFETLQKLINDKEIPLAVFLLWRKFVQRLTRTLTALEDDAESCPVI